MLLLGAEHLSVSFSGDVTILNIEAAYADLRAVLQQGGPVAMDVSGVTADLTFVQLIESARCKVAETGRDLVSRHPAKGAVLEMLERGGFLADGTSDTSDRAKFWLQGAAQ